MMNRRRVLTALGLCVLAAPFDSFAQQPGKVWRVGFLLGRRPTNLDSDSAGAFRPGMSDLGYVEGRNLVIEWRFTDAPQFERLADLAAELVRLKVDVIVSAGTVAISAAQKATATIPIVMANAPDPVGTGLVKSLARPGGNTTGLTNISVDVAAKHLEMLLSVVPKPSRVAVLLNPANASHAVVLKNVQTAAQRVGVKFVPVQAKTAQEIENAFSAMTRQHCDAVIVALDALFLQQRRQIAELAVKNRLPSITSFREYAEAGGLISYGPNLADQFRRAATYVDKIFKGARPGDLPVEQATKFELLINRKTAKALGFTIPPTLVLLADQVIE